MKQLAEMVGLELSVHVTYMTFHESQFYVTWAPFTLSCSCRVIFISFTLLYFSYLNHKANSNVLFFFHKKYLDIIVANNVVADWQDLLLLRKTQIGSDFQFNIKRLYLAQGLSDICCRVLCRQTQHVSSSETEK